MTWDDSSKIAAATALAKLGDISTLRDALSSSDDGAKVAALDGISRQDTDPVLVVEFATLALADQSEKVQIAAIRLLGKVGDKSAAPLLVDALESKNRQIRQKAISAGRALLSRLRENDGCQLTVPSR
jgi:HEAT repeat protein